MEVLETIFLLFLTHDVIFMSYASFLQHTEMFNLDGITSENNAKHNRQWSYIPTYTLLNLIKKQEQDNDKLLDNIYLYAKDVNKPKYKSLIKKREDARMKYLNDPKAFTEYLINMDDVYSNIDDYNSNGKRNILIVFDDTIPDIMANKKFQAIIKECRKLNIFLLFISESYFLSQKKLD